MALNISIEQLTLAIRNAIFDIPAKRNCQLMEIRPNRQFWNPSNRLELHIIINIFPCSLAHTISKFSNNLLATWQASVECLRKVIAKLWVWSANWLN